LKDLGEQRSKLEPTLFYWKKNGKLWGLMCTHVDDLLYAGNREFEEKVMKKMKRANTDRI